MKMSKYAAYIAMEKKHGLVTGHETPSYDSNGKFDEVVTFVKDGAMVAVYTDGKLYEI